MSTIGGNPGLGDARLQEALRGMRQQISQMQNQAGAGAGSTQAGSSASFDNTLTDTIASVDKSVRGTQDLHIEALRGDLDFHEVATRVKQAQLSFDFSMQVRNKLIDAYREVMRMTV